MAVHENNRIAAMTQRVKVPIPSIRNIEKELDYTYTGETIKVENLTYKNVQKLRRGQIRWKRAHKKQACFRHLEVRCKELRENARSSWIRRKKGFKPEVNEEKIDVMKRSF
ncbi:unnamed protein product [Owenia fusiformis]|uniref:Uncharacterized protein n=1 Tax=Owenia fusiformis TaxID=6347 RepID=A0A8S4N1U3_OWEFU|nr:unnamed protein product [Owenia fusiformis]